VERSDPVAPHDGVEPERHLVDQTAPRQIVGKLAATVGNQTTYMLLFQSGHLIGRVGSEELRVPGERLLDRV